MISPTKRTGSLATSGLVLNKSRDCARAIVRVALILGVSYFAADRANSADTLFGVQLKPEVNLVSSVEAAHQLGFGLVRIGLRWERVAIEGGVLDWSMYDDMMTAVKLRHMHVVFTLFGANRQYQRPTQFERLGTGEAELGLAAPVDGIPQEEFSAFVKAAVRRYDNDNVIWEIWNEPNNPRFWPPQADPENVGRFVGLICTAIRSVSPNAGVFAPGLAPVIFSDEVDMGFVRKMLRSRETACLTGISIHPYRKSSPTTLADDYGRLRDYLRVQSFGMPQLKIGLSEWGYSTGSRGIGRVEQADYLVKELTVSAALGTEFVVWYELRDSLQGVDGRERGFGLASADRKLKASGESARIVLPMLSTAEHISRVSTDCRDLALYELVSNNKRTYIIWSEFDKYDIRFADGSVERSGKFSDDPVRDADSANNIKISGHPVYVVMADGLTMAYDNICDSHLYPAGQNETLLYGK